MLLFFAFFGVFLFF